MANKTIQQLDPLTTADASDLLALYDVSGNGTNSITAANLLNTTTISGLETTAKTIPAAINELNNELTGSKLQSWTQIINGVQYASEGNHVFIRLNISTSVTTSFNTIATLPSGFRPSFNQYFRVTGSNGTGDITILVDISGNIQAKTDSGTNTAINGFICIA